MKKTSAALLRHELELDLLALLTNVLLFQVGTALKTTVINTYLSTCRGMTGRNTAPKTEVTLPTSRQTNTSSGFGSWRDKTPSG